MFRHVKKETPKQKKEEFDYKYLGRADSQFYLLQISVYQHPSL